MPYRPTAKLWLRSGLAIALAALLCLSAAPSFTQTTPTKLSIPEADARTKALEKLQAENKAAFDKAKTEVKARLDLAGELIKGVAGKAPPEQFVRLEQAWKLAAQGGDFHTASWAIEELDEQFQVDMIALKSEALKSAVQVATGVDNNTDLTDHTLKLILDAVERDNYDLATALGQVADDAARKSKDLPLVLTVQRERKWIAATKQNYQALKPFVDRLEKDPTDAEANLEVGKYLCYLKGDWERGLYLLAQSNDAKMRLLAQRDLSKPEAAKEQIEVGDAWWDVAGTHTDQVKVHMQQRAAFWYQQAVSSVEGLAQGKLEERIAAVPLSPKQGVPWDYSGPPGKIKQVGNHFGNIFAVTFSPDGKLVASGGSDTQAIIWELKTGKKLHVLTGHTSTVWGVAFDAKGKYLYTSGWDGMAWQWDVLTGKKLQRYPPQNQFGSMYGIAVSPNGRQLLTGTSDSAVRLWDIKTGKLIHTLHGHKGPVYGVTFFADGKKAVTSGSFDRLLIVWDLEKGKEIKRIDNPGTSGRYVSVTPDGTKVVASGEPVVRLWDLRTGKEIRQFQGHTSHVYAVSFSPNGKRLITGSLDGSIRYWDVNSGKELQKYTGHNSTVYALAFSAGGGRIISGGLDNSIILWGLPR